MKYGLIDGRGERWSHARLDDEMCGASVAPMVERPVPLPPLDPFSWVTPRAERPPKDGTRVPLTRARFVERHNQATFRIRRVFVAEGPMALVIPSAKVHAGRIMSMYTQILEAALVNAHSPMPE